MSLPLKLGPLDHYTLIVEDARATASFHEEVLGFRPSRIQKVNAGTAPAGGFDMLNHVLRLPDSEERVVVITEGLTEESIFSRYLQQYGPGVHHIAYEVANIEDSLALLRAGGVRTTASEPHRDPLTGLLQIFVSREPTGYFIELIERSPKASSGVFTNENMAALANTMTSYLESTDREVTAAEKHENPSVAIDVSAEEVQPFLLNPLNLPRWTGHRLIRHVDEAYTETRMHGDLGLKVIEEHGGVSYVWSKDDARKRVHLRVAATQAGCLVTAVLDDVPRDARAHVVEALTLELKILGAVMESRTDSVSQQDWERLTAYHLAIHQRVGL